MAADDVSVIGVMTADGQFVIAIPESHTVLFSAIRGGGGGGGNTWGVVASGICYSRISNFYFVKRKFSSSTTFSRLRT